MWQFTWLDIMHPSIVAKFHEYSRKKLPHVFTFTSNYHAHAHEHPRRFVHARTHVHLKEIYLNVFVSIIADINNIYFGVVFFQNFSCNHCRQLHA